MIRLTNHNPIFTCNNTSHNTEPDNLCSKGFHYKMTRQQMCCPLNLFAWNDLHVSFQSTCVSLYMFWFLFLWFCYFYSILVQTLHVIIKSLQIITNFNWKFIFWIAKKIPNQLWFADQLSLIFVFNSHLWAQVVAEICA